MNSTRKNLKKETAVIRTRVVSKPGATLEVKVVEMTLRTKRAIAEGLRLGRAAGYQDARVS